MQNNPLQPSSFKILPEVIKTLIVINGVMFVGIFSFKQAFGIHLSDYLGLYLPASEYFKPLQLVTHMFLHSESSIMHILVNMFMLWMFGAQMENMWGGKRFLTYYLLTGFGAALLHWGVTYIEYWYYAKQLPLEVVDQVIYEGKSILSQGKNYIDERGKINLLLHVPTIGASGAVYGVLMAYAMTFPNNIIYLYFAIPIKVKYFILGLIAVELFSGLSSAASNIAHFCPSWRNFIRLYFD